MTEIMDKLRSKDKIVLQAVREGNDDIQKITETTTLENHEVNYCFSKLEDLDLINVEKPDGYTTRNINGQKRVFQTPKQAKLTDKGEQYVECSEQEELDRYQNLSRKELIEKVHRLENEVQELQGRFKIFRQQVMDQVQ